MHFCMFDWRYCKCALMHPFLYFNVLLLSVLLASSSANGDRTKEKQRSGNSFVVDFDKKKFAAENLLEISYHGAIIVKVTSICLTSIIYLCKIPFLHKILYYSLSLSLCIDESNGGDLYQTCRTRSMERARQIGYNFRMVM